jgi:S-ribosylhomocysteine lyase LuxS involved in autoinducer biosynthesis
LLGGGMISLPGRNFARFILMQFILFSLIVRTGYQGVQFDMMLKVCRGVTLTCSVFDLKFIQTNLQEIRPKDVETIEEMIEQNFTFYADKETFEAILIMEFTKRLYLIQIQKH